MHWAARSIYQLNRLRWRITAPLTLGVRVLMVRETSVLLVRHTYQQSWYLPGGGVKKGESVEEAVRREAAEEVGGELGPIGVLGVYSNFYEGKSDHIVVFICAQFKHTGKTDHEIEQWSFFSADELPAGASPGTRRRIQEYTSGQYPAVGPW